MRQTLRGHLNAETLHPTNGRWYLLAERRPDTLQSFDQAPNAIRASPGSASTKTSSLPSTHKPWLGVGSGAGMAG